MASKKKQIALDVWHNASIDQRQEWLQAGFELDSLSSQVLGWALQFRDSGAHVPDDVMVRVYQVKRDYPYGYPA